MSSNDPGRARILRRAWPWAALMAVLSTAVAAPPVALTFPVAPDQRDPFARDIWAEVVTPSHEIIRLPAYYSEERRFTVRARADAAGEYRLGRVVERVGENDVELRINDVDRRPVTVTDPATRSPIGIGGEAPGRFVFSTGEPYVPIGANLAWAPEEEVVAWYREAFRAYAAVHANWTRVWMAHWDGLNLDWFPNGRKSPGPGHLDEGVAKRWDDVISAAEDGGIYLQMVLQHHGQYSSKVNPNWNENPWNAANRGGFLQSPADFFKSPKAMRLTKQKYRYIVARWGYSPAVLAWELFNEVHWVDALRIDHDEPAVAKWHDEMAACIRSVDVYRHLVTTSTEELRSPIYRSMDYLQPHLYATNMLAAARRFDRPPETLGRPVFYGEMGNDHMRLTDEQKAAAVEHVPIVWASLMGEGRYPAQIWEGAKIWEQDRLGELGAVARFLGATRLAERDGLNPFSARFEAIRSVPFVIEGAENWHKRPSPTLAIAMDGTQSLAYGTIPRILVGAARSVTDGYPDKITIQVNYPKPATARLRIADVASKGATVRVRVDGRDVAEHVWPVAHPKTAGAAVMRPVELSFPVAAGEHDLNIENSGGLDWVDFESLDLGLETAALAAIGRRGADFVALWIWQRGVVFAAETPAAVSGTVVIDEVAAGDWTAVWWDTVKGAPAEPLAIHHPGGALRLTTPPVTRHAALVLTR